MKVLKKPEVPLFGTFGSSQNLTFIRKVKQKKIKVKQQKGLTKINMKIAMSDRRKKLVKSDLSPYVDAKSIRKINKK